MSFSTLVVVGLLHFVGSAQGFSGVSGARFVSQRPRVLPALRAVNEFDAWQAARGALTTDAPGALPLSTDNVALVLGEFARSDFARRLCKPGSVSVVEHVAARHAHFHVLFLFMSCVHVRAHAVHDVRTPRHRNASTDTSRVPACRYDLNDQPDEGQVGAVFESVPKLTRTPRGLGVLYVRATRAASPRAARSKGASHGTSCVAHVPASAVPLHRVPWLPPQVGPASRRHAHREAPTVLRPKERGAAARSYVHGPKGAPAQPSP